jgi:hypothetical protein
MHKKLVMQNEDALYVHIRNSSNHQWNRRKKPALLRY